MDEQTKQRRTETMVAAIFAFALASAVCWIYWYGVFGGLDWRVWVTLGVFAVVLVIADHFSVDATPDDPETISSYGVWDLLETCALVMLGPTWATLSSAPSALWAARRSQDLIRALFEFSNSAARIHLAALPFAALAQPVLENSLSAIGAGDLEGLLALGLGTALAGTTIWIVNTILSMVPLRVRYGKPFREQAKNTVSQFWIADVMHVVFATLAAVLLVISGVAAAFVVVVAGVLSSFFAYTMSERAKERHELEKRISSLEGSSLLMNSPLARMILHELGQRDGFSDRHAAATAVYAGDLVLKRNGDPEQARQVREAAFLHNIGLYHSPRPRQNWRDAEVPEHPRLSAEVIKKIPGNEQMAWWVQCHHERVDGKGFPNGFRGDGIPEEAQVIAIAQAYAALVLDKDAPNEEPGEPPAEAQRQIVEGKNTQFSVRWVHEFIDLLDNAEPDYAAAVSERFSALVPENPVNAHADSHERSSTEEARARVIDRLKYRIFGRGDNNERRARPLKVARENETKDDPDKQSRSDVRGGD